MSHIITRCPSLLSVPTTTVYLLVYLLDFKVTYIKLSKNAFHMHCLSTHYSILYYNNLFFFLALRLIFQLLTVTIFTEFQFLCSLLRAVETYKTLGLKKSQHSWIHQSYACLECYSKDLPSSLISYRLKGDVAGVGGRVYGSAVLARARAACSHELPLFNYALFMNYFMS